MKAKGFSLDDWNALSDEAQIFEIASFEYEQEARKRYLDKLEDALPRKDGKITAGESYMLVLLARMELF